MALEGRVCIVTGASRGIGKGIAVQLGEAGATVYITGRTLKTKDGQPGSLEETASEITHRGGKGIAVQCDHKDKDKIQKLFERVKREQRGRLDLLVNNAYSAVQTLFENYGKKFYESPPELWDDVNDVGLRNHYYCSWHAVQIMKPRNEGLIVNISSAGGLVYYIGVAYGVGKEACGRMAKDIAIELQNTGISCVCLWPGPVKTEKINEVVLKGDTFGEGRISEKEKQRGKTMFENGETPEFTGRAIVELMKDKKLKQKSGRTMIVSELAGYYGFTDIDGRRPLSQRSLKSLLTFYGMSWLAWIVPRWIKVPYWMLTLAGSKF